MRELLYWSHTTSIIQWAINSGSVSKIIIIESTAKQVQYLLVYSQYCRSSNSFDFPECISVHASSEWNNNNEHNHEVSYRVVSSKPGMLLQRLMSSNRAELQCCSRWWDTEYCGALEHRFGWQTRSPRDPTEYRRKLNICHLMSLLQPASYMHASNQQQPQSQILTKVSGRSQSTTNFWAKRIR